MRIAVCEMKVDFETRYVYVNYAWQGRSNPKPRNINVRGNGKGEAMHSKYKRLKLVSGQTCYRSTNYSFRLIK
jgi:hypothetical protein